MKRNKIIIITILFFTLLFIIKSILSSQQIINNLKNIIANDFNNIVNNSIKVSIVNKLNLDDYLEVNYSNNSINSIDYNLKNTYLLLGNIRKEIDNEFNKLYKSKISDYSYIINAPYYGYKNNVLINKISPKVNVKIDVLNGLSMNVNTKVKDYGINSLLLELYLDINFKCYFYYYSEDYIDNNYSVLIASKVIMGDIPSVYGKDYTKSSPIFNF